MTTKKLTNSLYCFSPPQHRRVSCAAAKSLQLCPTPCNPLDGSPPASSVLVILQAGILEWVAISFSSRVPQGGNLFLREQGRESSIGRFCQGERIKIPRPQDEERPHRGRFAHSLLHQVVPVTAALAGQGPGPAGVGVGGHGRGGALSQRGGRARGRPASLLMKLGFEAGGH